MSDARPTGTHGTLGADEWAGIVARGKASGIVRLWAAGVWSDREAYDMAQELLQQAPELVKGELRELVEGMLREIRRRWGWQ